MLESYQSGLETTRPVTQILEYDEWPEVEDGSFTEVEFRLIYHGKLPAASHTNTRVSEKHLIRKALHPQLKELWRVDPQLSWWLKTEGAKQVTLEDGTTGWVPVGPQSIERIADDYRICGFRFAPLIGNCRLVTAACELDILFLRRDPPGQVMTGGDIDNRMKVLFDAFRIPRHCSELRGAVPEDGEDPFYCLLEDDSLITQIKITTDRLLSPPRDDEHHKDVHLVIDVRVLGAFFPQRARVRRSPH
jgi:hypothetical protein